MMRRLLINHAQSRNAARRGGDAVHITLDEGVPAEDHAFDDVLSIDQALTRLAAFEAGDDYNWGLFTYIYDEHSSGQSFEVLNYWVEP